MIKDRGEAAGIQIVQLIVTGDEVTGSFNGNTATKASSLFSGASSFQVRLRDHTGGPGTVTETSARDNVVVEAFDDGGGGGNSPPTASFTHDCPDLTCTFDGTGSSDPDGDTLSYAWDFGDGSTGSGDIVTHTYDVCPGGTFTVTLTVSDGNGGTGEDQQDVAVSDVDSDGDGLWDCEEVSGGTDDCGNSWGATDPNNADTDNDGLSDGHEVFTHCTDPNDPDTDDDEFGDWDEVNNFGLSNPSAVFCGSAGCAYPDPTTRDIYFEIDGIEDHCGLFGCDKHMISDIERDRVVAAFENTDEEPIHAYFDTGQYASTNAHGGQMIDDDNLEGTVTWSYLENNIEDNGNYFDSRRAGIFHHMIAVHDVTRNGDDSCGVGQSRGSSEADGRADFSAIAHGRITTFFGGCDDGDMSLSVVTTTLEEFGHNFFGEIEPVLDQCDSSNDRGHDKYGDWAMDGGSEYGCEPRDVNANYYDPSGPAHRWWEAKHHVFGDSVETECTDDEARNDPLSCPSPGDLNDGLVGKWP